MPVARSLSSDPIGTASGTMPQILETVPAMVGSVPSSEIKSVGMAADDPWAVIDEDGRLIGMVRRATITRYLFDVLFGEEEPSAE